MLSLSCHLLNYINFYFLNSWQLNKLQNCWFSVNGPNAVKLFGDNLWICKDENGVTRVSRTFKKISSWRWSSCFARLTVCELESKTYIILFNLLLFLFEKTQNELKRDHDKVAVSDAYEDKFLKRLQKLSIFLKMLFPQIHKLWPKLFYNILLPKVSCKLVCTFELWTILLMVLQSSIPTHDLYWLQLFLSLRLQSGKLRS